MKLKEKKLCIWVLYLLVAVLLCNLKLLEVNAATADRIWGQDRYQTASSIALKGWQTATYAIVVTGDNYPDALAATPLSKRYDAPILLTEENKLTSDTLNTLKQLKVSGVYIVGGTGVVSENVYNSIKSNGMKVHRIAGANRYETSVEVAKFIGVDEGVFIVNGGDFGDALSVGPIAANLGMPIILTDKKNLDPKVENYLKANKANKSYVIGDSTVISDSVVNKLPNPERVFGSDIYARNTAVLERFRNVLDFTNAYVSTGANFPDALAGGALASKNGNPLILTALDPSVNTLRIIKDNRIANITTLGGEGAVSTTAVNKLLAKAAEIVDYTNIPDDTVITGRFSDKNFKKEIYTIIGKNSWEPILYSDVKDIEALDVGGRNIKSLDGIEYFTALKYLGCYNNQLTSLDISNNINLIELGCTENKLTSLDISRNTALTVLGCATNQLTALDLSNNTALKLIDCRENQIAKIDASNNAALTKLYCERNNLTILDISNNYALTDLNCSFNKLTMLDVSKNTALTNLDCGTNRLKALDVSKNTELTMLWCSSNELTKLDVSNSIYLLNLNCRANRLTSLEISKNAELLTLYCEDNHLTALDVSKNTVLTDLFCGINKLTALDVSRNTALIRLWCDTNEIIELDVSKNTNLSVLNCRDNRIATLVTSNNTALIELICGQNKLTKLDISKNIGLTEVWCSDNEIEELNVSENIALTKLGCFANRLKKLDLTNNINLTELRCSDNYITELDLSKNTKLTFLACYNNQIKTLYCYTDKLDSMSFYKDQYTDSSQKTITKNLVITIKR